MEEPRFKPRRLGSCVRTLSCHHQTPRGPAGSPSSVGPVGPFRATRRDWAEWTARASGGQSRGTPCSTEGAAAMHTPPHGPEGLHALCYLYVHTQPALRSFFWGAKDQRYFNT